MTLQDWIDQKAAELKTEMNYREAVFRDTLPCKLSARSVQMHLSIGGPNETVPLDTEVKEVDRSLLPDTFLDIEYLPGVQVTFEVLKPRKRYTQHEYFYLLIA